jgi:hypothetical protein
MSIFHRNAKRPGSIALWHIAEHADSVQDLLRGLGVQSGADDSYIETGFSEGFGLAAYTGITGIGAIFKKHQYSG